MKKAAAKYHALALEAKRARRERTEMSESTNRLTDAVTRFQKVVEEKATDLERRYSGLESRVLDGAHKLEVKCKSDEAAITAFEDLVNQLTNSGGLTDEQIAAENAAEGVAGRLDGGE